MRVGVGSCFEDFGAELVTHEDVVAQIDVHTAGTDAVCHLFCQRQHLGAVGGEMKV